MTEEQAFDYLYERAGRHGISVVDLLSFTPDQVSDCYIESVEFWDQRDLSPLRPQGGTSLLMTLMMTFTVMLNLRISLMCYCTSSGPSPLLLNAAIRSFKPTPASVTPPAGNA